MTEQERKDAIAKYDSLWEAYLHQLKKLNSLRALAERGVEGERAAAVNAIRDQRISVLEAKLEAVTQWIRIAT